MLPITHTLYLIKIARKNPSNLLSASSSKIQPKWESQSSNNKGQRGRRISWNCKSHSTIWRRLWNCWTWGRRGIPRGKIWILTFDLACAYWATLKWSFYFSFCPSSAVRPSVRPKKILLTLPLRPTSAIRPGVNPIRWGQSYTVWSILYSGANPIRCLTWL